MAVVALFAWAPGTARSADTPRVADSTRPIETSSGTLLVSIGEGQSRMLDLPSAVKRVVANDPAGQILLPQNDQTRGAPGPKAPGAGDSGLLVARAQLLSPRQLVITGIHVGTTQFVLIDEQDKATVYDVLVQINAAQLKAMIAESAPGSAVDVKLIRDTIFLTGKVTDVDTAKRIEDLAKALSPNVQNHMTVAGEQQVLLRCTVAEVNKEGLRQLGVNGWLGGGNFHDVFAVNQIGAINPSNIGAAAFGPVGGAAAPNIPFATDEDGIVLRESTTFSLGFPRMQMQLFFQAMRRNSLLKVLAEPNLVALNGQTATFVAGGEFPVPIPQGVGGAVTIEFKEFGVRLKFQPTIIGQQMVRLKVTPEVSELNFQAAVQFSGFVIPALTKRSAETTIELGSGTTIAIAGLLSENVRAQASKIPALGDVPVLGALFSSNEYRRSISELVILVTPELVSGMNPDQVPPVPGQLISEPNDWQFFGLGMVEGEPTCDPTSPEDALDTHPDPGMRRFTVSPHQMSLHGPWGPAPAAESNLE